MHMAFCYKKIKKISRNKNISTNVGDEGGFAPSLASDEEAIEVLMSAITQAGFKPGKDISICLDVAANELKEPKVWYFLDLTKKYPIKSIEDPFQKMTGITWNYNTKNWFSIVGDDLFVTNAKRLKKGIKENVPILIKPNQIGTKRNTRLLGWPKTYLRQ